MSSPIVAVNIVRRPSPNAQHSVKTRSFVHLDASVADLRQALLDDQVILPTDKFYIDGRALAKTSEKHTKWSEVLREVLVMGGEEMQGNDFYVKQSLCACQTPVHAPAQFVLPKYRELSPYTYGSDISEAKTFVEVPATPIHRITTIHHVEHPVVKPAVSFVQEATIKTLVEEPFSRPTVVTNPCLCQACQGAVTPVPEVTPLIPVELEAPHSPDTTQDVQELPLSPAKPDSDEVLESQPLEPEVSLQEEAIETKHEVEIQPARLVEEVTNSSDVEQKLLLLKSGLGSGIDIHECTGPNKTRLPVVGQINVANVRIKNVDTESEEIIITTSDRAAAYAKSGWEKSCLSAQHPWVTDGVESVTEETTEYETAEVIGRYVYSKCLLSISNELQPHPDLKRAVDDALALANPRTRSAELGDIFRKFGHFYVAAVELGGMQHTNCALKMSATKTRDHLETEMQGTLNKLFGSGYGCPCSECEEASFIFDDAPFQTVGGVTQLLRENDLDEWKSSLTSSANWSVTRIMRVESVIDLFDEATRAKILASAPEVVSTQLTVEATPEPVVAEPEVIQVTIEKVPLHRLYSSRSGEHYYTTKVTELDKAVGVLGYNYEALAAHILPSQIESTIPLYRVRKGQKHIYTANLAEIIRASGDKSSPAIVGYVYATQVQGTFPLYRLHNSRSEDRLFTTSIDEKLSLLRVGWQDEGIACYVYL